MSDQMSMLPSGPLPSLDPPFRGYIETTFDALLVFEAARRGMIPRVTRRLIERERGMVQSGAVFVFDEHESGIKRWTDGLIWSPSRILGNFLVYRETDKKNGNPPTPISTHPSSSPSDLPMGIPHQIPQYGESSQMGRHTPPHPLEPPPVLGAGALHRPQSSGDGGSLDRQKERQLVGSLTNSYKFKDRGLVKKTMSVTVNGFAQHMISYYTVEDVLAGKLRSPSTIPELAALEISPEYLHKANFRFPPMVEIGPDGIPRYRGEPEEPMSPTSPTSGLSMGSFPTSSSNVYDQMDSYGSHPQMSAQSVPRNRSVTVPMSIPLSSSAGQTYFAPGSAGSGYYEPPAIVRQSSASSMHSASGMRPNSGSRRFEPYAPQSPRGSHLQAQQAQQRRPSQPIAIPQPADAYYAHPHQHHHHASSYDVKPEISGSSSSAYSYQPPQTAPSAFADFYPGSHSSHPQLQQHAQQPQQYAAWPQPPPSASGRMMPREYAPPGSAGGSSGSGGSVPPTSAASGQALGQSHPQAPGSASLADSGWAGAPQGIGGWDSQGAGYDTWRT